MLAQTLALALVLASAGTPRIRPAIEPLPDNAVRARRGLLPRKLVKARAPSRRRVVLLPQAPTWLGEPGEVTEPPEVIAEPALDGAVEPVAARLEPAGAAIASVDPDDGLPPLRARLDGAAVEWQLLRRLRASEGPSIRVTLAEPELEVVLLRRLTPAQ